MLDYRKAGYSKSFTICWTKDRRTAPELAEKLEVSVRTIYRDINAISSAGIPVYVTTGIKGGISLLAVQYPTVSIILNKLAAIFQIRLTDWSEVDFTRWGSTIENETKLFNEIKQAIFEKCQIVFDYLSAGAMEKREVQPLKSAYKDKAWYLCGFCLLRKDYRLFRLSRIKQMTLTGTNFERAIVQAAEIFQKAGLNVSSIQDILQLGIYITNAVKTPKTEAAIKKESIDRSIPYLETELSLFPNVKVIMLMGDVAKKAFNIITKKTAKKNAVPSLSTYKLRNSEIYYGTIRVIPSYIMTGGNLLIEKSKVEMAAEDISIMAALIF